MRESGLARAAQERLAILRYRGASFRRRRRAIQIETVEPSPYDRRAQRVTWFSPTLGVRKRLHICLPNDYASSNRRYPVLYLLRGHEREWLNLDEDTSRHGKNVIDVYERLRDEGRVGPMILVMPSLSSDDNSMHGIGVDNLAPWLAGAATGMGTGRWETYLLRDVLPLVDTQWRTLASGAHRGLAGFSLGGAVAAKLAAKYPTFFASVGTYDGTFFFAAEDGKSVRPDDRVLHNPIFEPAFGRRRDLAHATANSPVNLIRDGDGAALGRVTWMIQYGPEAIEPWGSNFYRGEHLVEALERRGIANAVKDRVLADGDHTWRTADRHVALTLPTHWQVLRKE